MTDREQIREQARRDVYGKISLGSPLGLGRGSHWKEELATTIIDYLLSKLADQREEAARIAEACYGAGAHTKPQQAIAAALRAKADEMRGGTP